jgi:hypothetical protein
MRVYLRHFPFIHGVLEGTRIALSPISSQPYWSVQVTVWSRFPESVGNDCTCQDHPGKKAGYLASQKRFVGRGLEDAMTADIANAFFAY